MFSKFNEEARKVLVLAKKEMQELKHPYIGSEHMMLSLLKLKDNEYIEKLKKHGITYKIFKDELIKVVGIGSQVSPFFLYTPLLKNIIANAVCDSDDKGKDEVDVNDLLLAIFNEGEGVAIRLILGMGANFDKLYDELVNNYPKTNKNSKLYVESFGIDLNKKAINKELDPVIGREKEINRLMEILGRRTKNNPLLIGDAGVGKTAIVEELAKRIVEGKVGDNLRNKKIISVPMASLVSGTKYRGEFEERIGKIIGELEKNSSVILFIDEIHTLVGAGGAEGAIDASNILKPALARGKIKIIGATTTEEYKKFIEDDRALERRFQIVNIDEPEIDVVKDILMQLKPIYESYHQVKINKNIIDDIIFLSNKFLYDRKMPDKAIDVLDEVCSKVSMFKEDYRVELDQLRCEYDIVKNLKNTSIINNDFDKASLYKEQEIILEDKINNIELEVMNHKRIKVVTKDDVIKVIEAKSKIPVYDIKNDGEIKKIKNILLDEVKGQEEAINLLCNVSKKITLGLKKDNKPISILFTGSTGVGKTLLAKKYAEVFLNKSNYIRLDMSEFKEAHSVSKIIGAPPGYMGYDDNKNVLEEVKEKPYSLILLDEIDKANRNVIELFLQIFDEGKMKNSKGEVIRFDNNIIVMTFNTGSKNKGLGFNDNNLVNQKVKEQLGVEILNRIDYVVNFNDIDNKTVNEIISKKIDTLKNHYHNNGIVVKIDNKMNDKLIELCKYHEYGARKIDKVIDKYVDNYIVDELLKGNKVIKIDNIDVGVG